MLSLRFLRCSQQSGFVFLYLPNTITYLQPLLLPEIIERCRNEVEETLQNEWICPELKIQDFDEYVCLINGQVRGDVNEC